MWPGPPGLHASPQEGPRGKLTTVPSLRPASWRGAEALGDPGGPPTAPTGWFSASRGATRVRRAQGCVALRPLPMALRCGRGRSGRLRPLGSASPSPQESRPWDNPALERGGEGARDSPLATRAAPSCATVWGLGDHSRQVAGRGWTERRSCPRT